MIGQASAGGLLEHPLFVGAVVAAWASLLGLLSYVGRRVISGQERQDTKLDQQGDKLDGLDRRLSVKEGVDDERDRHTTERLTSIEHAHAEFRGEMRTELAAIHRRVDDLTNNQRREPS